MYHITPRAFAHAMSMCAHTAYRRLKNVPFRSGPAGEHFIPVISALTTVREKELYRVRHVFDHANDMEDTTPEQAARRADEFELWLQNMRSDRADIGGAVRRLRDIRRAYIQHVADSFSSNRLMHHSEYIRNVLPNDNNVLRYVLTGEKAYFPRDFRDWSIKHAIQNLPTTDGQLAA